MGRAMVVRLGLGLLLLALLLPTQIYCNQTSVAPFSGNQNISAAPNPTNATTRSGCSSLQSTAGLLALSLSLLHLYCQRLRPRNVSTSPSRPTPNGNHKSNVTRKRQVHIKSAVTITSTENTENPKFDWLKGRVKGLRAERCQYGICWSFMSEMKTSIQN